MFKSAFCIVSLMVPCAAFAQQPTATKTPTPKDVASCMALLHDVGPKTTGVTEGKKLAEIKRQGAQMAALCQQQKFSDAALMHDAIHILLNAKK